MTVIAYGLGYALAGWAVAAVGGVSYVVWVLQRGRRTSQQVSAARRRWGGS